MKHDITREFDSYRDARQFATKQAEKSWYASRIVEKDDKFIVQYSFDFDIDDIIICGTSSFCCEERESVKKPETPPSQLNEYGEPTKTILTWDVKIIK